MIQYRRTFSGRGSIPTGVETIRELVITFLKLYEEGAAWEIARRVNCLGSSVSSEMFKMRKAGLIKDTGRKTSRGGRVYAL